MGILDIFSNTNQSNSDSRGAIDYGNQKRDGGHDHRTNRGDDRTPSQKRGDESRRDRSDRDDD